MSKLLSLLLVPALLAADLAAQLLTLPMDPRATFLRTNNDSPAPPVVLDLAAIPAPVGCWLRLESRGAYRHIVGGTDTTRNLIGVFSGSDVLLATGVQQRVPDAIEAGPSFVGGLTYYGSLPIDTPQDFYIGRSSYENGVFVQVPAGATHLFLGVYDTLFNDNVDPNQDFGATLDVVGPIGLPGTGEHIELRSGVGAPATALPLQRLAPPGATIDFELIHSVGFLEGDLYAIAADFVATGAPAPSILPRVWLGPTPLVVQLGVIPATAGWSTSWTVTLPPGLIGVSMMVQGGALSPLADNGLYETTFAHRYALQ